MTTNTIYTMYMTDPSDPSSHVVEYKWRTPHFDGTTVTESKYLCGDDGCQATWTFHPGTSVKYVIFALVHDFDDAIPVEELNCHTVTTIVNGVVNMNVVPGPDCIIDPNVDYEYRTWLSGSWSCSGECSAWSHDTIKYGEWKQEEHSKVRTYTSSGSDGGSKWSMQKQMNLVSFCS